MAIIVDIYQTATKNEAEKAYAQFIEQYEDKYPKATGCLRKDKQALFSFYDFPAKHWQHIRTTNPIESTFATVRYRTRKTKGCGSRAATLTMVFKLAKTAQKRWRRLRGYQLIDIIINGVQFVGGEEKTSKSSYCINQMPANPLTPIHNFRAYLMSF